MHATTVLEVHILNPVWRLAILADLLWHFSLFPEKCQDSTLK